MGLLDDLRFGSQGGYGGLLDMLMYQSPLNQRPQIGTPSFGPNGEFDPGSVRADPFGPIPQVAPPAAAPSVWDEAKPAPPPAPMMPAPAQNIMGALPGMLAPTPDKPLNQFEQQMMAMVRPGGPSPQPPAAVPTPAPRPAPVASAPQATDFSAQNRPQAPQAPQELPPAFGGSNSSYLDRINAGGSLIGSLFGSDTSQQKNLNAQYQALSQALTQSGMPAREAQSKAMLAILNPKAGESIFAQAFGNKEPPKTVEEFTVRNAWENRGRDGGASGLPTTIQDLEQQKIAQKAAEKRATTIAEKQAELAASLPDTLLRAEQTIKQIDEVKGHSSKGIRTGFPSILPAIPGTGGADFDERVKQLKGGAFLDAYKMLRGTGAISEAEGIKAEAAQARLSQAKSEKDFNQALDDMREVVVKGYANAQKQAGEQKIKPYEMPVGQARNIGGVTIKRVN